MSIHKSAPRTAVLPCLFTLLLAMGLASEQVAAQQPAPKPPPDLIVFTNGDQLTGTFERSIGGNIVFKSDMAGEITVPIAKVKQLRAGGSFAVLTKDRPVTKQPVTPGAVALQGDNITVSNSNATNTEVPVKNLAFIIDKATYDKETKPHPSFFYGWNGAITGGATLVRSTQNGSTYNAGIALVRAIPTVGYLPKRNRTIFDLTETYGKITQPGAIPQTAPPTPDVTTLTSIFHSDAERDEYLSQRVYALGSLTFDHNYSQGLSFQQVYGGGFGWTAIQNPKQQLDLRFDIHYEKQAYIAPTTGTPATPNQNLIGATIQENYTRHLPAKLLFTETADILPAFNNTSAYSANATAILALPVYHRLAVNFTTTDNFLNDPAVGYKKNSYQFVTGVTYTLH